LYDGTQIGIRKCVKRRHLGTETSQLGDHPLGHGQIDKGLTAGVGALKIAGEPTVTRDPAKGSFHHPSFGKHVEAFGDDRVPVDFRPFRNPDPPDACPSVLNDLEANAKVVFHPLLEGIACIPAIDPDQLEARQFSEQSGEQHLAPFAIRDLSRKHFHGDHEPQRVYQEVPFSAPDFVNLSKGVTPFTRLQNWT
jgi:hypothetical protein